MASPYWRPAAPRPGPSTGTVDRDRRPGRPDHEAGPVRGSARSSSRRLPECAHASSTVVGCLPTTPRPGRCRPAAGRVRGRSRRRSRCRPRPDRRPRRRLRQRPGTPYPPVPQTAAGGPSAPAPRRMPHAHAVPGPGGPSTGSRVVAGVVALLAVAGAWLVWRFFVDTFAGQMLERAAFDGAVTGQGELWAVAEPVLDTVSVAFVVGGLGAAMGIALLRRRWGLAVQVAFLVVGANVTTQLVKHSLLGREELIGGWHWENSLPSGHTTVAGRSRPPCCSSCRAGRGRSSPSSGCVHRRHGDLDPGRPVAPPERRRRRRPRGPRVGSARVRLHAALGARPGRRAHARLDRHGGAPPARRGRRGRRSAARAACDARDLGHDGGAGGDGLRGRRRGGAGGDGRGVRGAAPGPSVHSPPRPASRSG